MNSHPTVLIVDDDEGIRRTLEMILAKKNYRAFTAPDGKTALTLARQHEFDLALLDIRLPDVSGADLLAQLKALQPDLEALIITGNATLESAIQALANGAYHYFIKPLNPDELLIALEHALDKRRLVIENRALLASLQSIFRAAPTGIGVVANRVLLQVNDRICEMTGYAREELVGQSARILYPTAEDFEYVGTEKYRQIREHGIGTVETRWRRKDGAVLDVLLSSVPLDPGDLAKGVTFTALDITERKRAAEALRESHDRLLAVLDSIEGDIYVADLQTYEILFVNQHMRSSFGGDLVGQVCWKVFRNETQRCPHCTNDRLVDAAGNPTGVIVWEGQNPLTQRWYTNYDRAIRWLDGRLVRVQIATDITDRKRAEEELRENEIKYRTQFEASMDAIFVETLEGKVLDCNDAACKMLGYSKAELTALTVADLVPEQVAQTLPAVITEELTTGGVLIEAFNKRKNGKVFPCEVSTRFVTIGGEPRVIAYVRDITDRKRAEEELRESERRLAVLMSHLPGMAYRCANDPDWTMEFVSEGCLTLTGYSAVDLTRNAKISYAQVIHPEDRAAVWRGVQTALEEKRAYQLTYRIVAADGKTKWVWEQGSGVFTEDGTLVALEGFIADITERKRAEEELRAAEASYRTLFENVPDGVYRSTLDGKFLAVNPALVQIFGYASTEELLMADIPRDLFFQPETRQAWIEEILQKGELRNVEMTIKRKDGQPIVVLDNCRVIRDAQGNALFLEGTLTDITGYRQREREIQAVAAVSAALRAATTRAEMLPIILDQVQSFLNSDALSLNTRDPLTGETVIELARGAWASATGTRIPAHQGIAARVMDSRQPYLTNDLQNDPLFYWKNLIGDLRGYVGMPLIVQDRAVGILSIGCHYAIAPEQVNVLKAIADIVASALHRAALHEKTEQRLQHLVALRTVDQTINASLDLRFTLTVLLEQVIAQLHVDAADVLLYDSALRTLGYAAGRGFRTQEIERLTLRLGEGYAGKVALEHRTLTIRNLAAREPGRASILAGEGFVAYCGVPLIAKGQLTGVLEVFHRAPFIADPEWLDLLEMLAGQAAIAIDNARLFEELERSSARLVQSYDATIEGWSRALELRDRETEGHTQRVAQLTEQLARAVGIGEAELIHLRRGALLHDIGKIAVPDHILLKPAELTDDEWVIMRRHPEFAFNLLKPIPYLQPALDIPHYHHEKWDGTGYPRGLQGEAIPLPARVFALVDVWDALRSDRPYRPAWNDARAREHLRQQAGKHFDPNLVERFLKLVG